MGVVRGRGSEMKTTVTKIIDRVITALVGVTNLDPSPATIGEVW